MTLWIYANAASEVANRINPDGSYDSRSILDPELAAWIAAGNEPDPYAPLGGGGDGLQDF